MLKVPYETDKELDETINELIEEAGYLADLRNGFIEMNVTEPLQVSLGHDRMVHCHAWVHHLDFQRKERYHAARFEKDTRYYVIRLSKDLLEDWIITLINGRIKSKLGQSRTLAFANFNETFDSLSANQDTPSTGLSS